MKFLTVFLISLSFIYAKDNHENYQHNKHKELLPAFSFERRADNALDTFRYQDSYTPVALTEKKNLFFQKGKRTVVFFFSAVCSHCHEAIPKILELKDIWKKEKVDLILIATKSNKEDDIYKFISKFKLSVPIFQDTKSSFARKYGIGLVPVVMVINEQGLYFRINPFHKNKARQTLEHIFSDQTLFPIIR